MISETRDRMVREPVLERIAARAFAQTMAMIHIANTRKDKEPGDPKVGGHPAACASCVHILSALHLRVRAPQDYVCCKPHASPVDHALHHLLGLFRHQDGRWFSPAEGKALMERLRKFPEPGAEEVFQSYHARTDPDHFHFLPSGSVGIPPVVSVYLALAYRYARDHGWEVPVDAHFWSLIGDSEFREGSLLECMPDTAERQLGNVTWIIDYNRQNLDGTRISNDRCLEGADCDRIERTAVANGWRVIQVRHGRRRKELFARAGGRALQEALEGGLSDYEFQMLALSREAAAVRELLAEKHPGCTELLQGLNDAEVVEMLLDLGGHCMEELVDALSRSKLEPDVPYLVIVHTLKGHGLACMADPANHSALPEAAEIEQVLQRNGLSLQDPFALFDEGSAEGLYLAERRAAFREGVREHAALRERNRARVRAAIEQDGGIPESLKVDLSLFPMAHTQWMWGQLAAKLVRIGTTEKADAKSAPPRKDMTDAERRWKTAAEFVLTLSPDVGSSTNISPAMDTRIYGPEVENAELEKKLQVKYKHPELVTHQDARTRHIRFEIAEANAMSAVGAFGKMVHFVGLPFFPIMTVYDFFIKRALDQLYYNLYWRSEFVVMGTPSGVTLSAEGAQHSWKSDIQIPNLITWEPCFAQEVDWILADAIRRHMMDENDGRRGVLIRCVTRGLKQALLLENLRKQAKNKVRLKGHLKPRYAGPDWGEADDESMVASLPDDQLLARVRSECLAGAYTLVDWRGYAGYEPGDNVVHIFAMGALVSEALAATEDLLARGIFANVIVVSSPELLLGILGEESDYRHLRQGLGITGDLYAVPARTAGEAEVLSIAGRRVPIVAVCDGEAGLLDNIGSIIGVKQTTLAVRKFSKCGRPSQVYRYQGLDRNAIVQAVGKVLSETALEDLLIAPALLERLAGRGRKDKADWRELWPEAAGGKPEDAH